MAECELTLPAANVGSLLSPAGRAIVAVAEGILVAREEQEPPEPIFDFEAPESIIVWITDVGEGNGRTSFAPWNRFTIETSAIHAYAAERKGREVVGAAAYEESYGCGLDDLAENLIAEPAEGWWVVEGITAVFHKGDGWTTDDDMDFYCEGVRPATAEEINPHMTTEEMIAELRAREDATLSAIADELAKLGKLRLLVADFVVKNEIRCAETIYQTDRVIENAPEFIELLCDEVGYHKDAYAEGGE